MMRKFQVIGWKTAPVLVFGSFLFSLAACSEIDQQAKIEKVYAGKKDARAYEGDKFKGDKAKWETAMAERSKTQNEYVKTDAK